MPFSVATWNINSVRLRMPIVERLLAGARARRALPAGDEVSGRTLPLRALPRARLPACRDPRPEGLSRRRHHLAPAARSRRAPPLLRDCRQPPPLRARPGRRPVDPAPQFLRPGRRRRARPGDQSEIPPQARFRRRNERRARRAGRPVRLDPRRRSEHRAAGTRRLVAQAAAEGRQPHAGRDRGLRGDAQSRRLGRPDAAATCLHEQKLYTWWSYRAADWAASDRGRRLDHIWSSENLAPRLAGIDILRDARGWDRPSDHVPVIARFDFD